MPSSLVTQDDRQALGTVRTGSHVLGSADPVMPVASSPSTVRVTSSWVILLLVLLIGCGSDHGIHRSSSTAGRSQYPGWTTHLDKLAGFTVSYPPQWHRALAPVAPGLFDPRERLALATYPLRRWPEPCVGRSPGRPGNRDLGPRDAFVTVQERGRNPGNSWSDFPRRPTHFTFEQGAPAAEVGCATELGAVARLINFTDSGRHFDAIVILGRAVSAQTRRDALRVLDSLRFSANTLPSWRASQ